LELSFRLIVTTKHFILRKPTYEQFFKKKTFILQGYQGSIVNLLTNNHFFYLLTPSIFKLEKETFCKNPFYMPTLYTQEEIQENLSKLLNKRDLVQNKRVALLKKHTAKSGITKKQQEENTKVDQLDLEIENWERRLEKLF
jgi:hypothetical protein